MDRSNQPIDEYTLAAFIAGTLDETRRREVIAYLAEHPEARTLLHMAYEAMDAAPTPEPVPTAGAGADRLAAPAPVAPRRDWAARSRTWSRYLTSALAVALIGLGLAVLFNHTSDGLRTSQLTEEARLVVDIQQPDLAFSWNAVPNAYVYRIVVWDPEGVRQVDEYETADTEIDADGPFMRGLRARLVTGHRYSIRVDAINAQRRQIQSSETTDFVYGQPD